MPTAVQVTRYQAKDGSLHDTQKEAVIHENFVDPPEVDAKAIRYAGPSSDLHTNTWDWKCGLCSEDGKRVNTMFRQYSETCRFCNATNLFDFSRHGA